MKKFELTNNTKLQIADSLAKFEERLNKLEGLNETTK